MTIYPYQQISDRDDRDNSEYDLDSEKMRIEAGTEEIKKELVVRWKEDYKNSLVFPDKLHLVNPQLIDFLLSYQNVLLYNDIAKKFRLLPEQRDMLPQIVWHICLNNDWERTPDIIKTNLGVSDSNSITDSLNSILSQAKEMVRKQGTISQKYSEEKPAPEKKVSVTLQEALRTYPELGEQSISSQKITLKGFPDPVRPSIKNWLSEYTFALGYDNHTTISRNNFLFQNENAKALSNQDRQKLSYLLKAFDEKSPITVDVATKQIMFPEVEVISEQKPVNSEQNSGRKSIGWQDAHSFPKNSRADDIPKKDNAVLSFDHRPESVSAANNMKFSSPQKLPYEKADEKPKVMPQPIEPKPAPIQPPAVQPQPRPMIISSGYNRQEPEEKEKQPPQNQPLPRNVVDLRE